MILTMKNVRDIIDLETRKIAYNEDQQSMLVIQYKERETDKKTRVMSV